MALLTNFWQLFVLSAPWLLLGLFVAGVIHVFIPKDLLGRHLGKEGLWTTIKAALIGAPMPLCSCGVIPAAIGLRRAGASKSATTAFLVSTPETGVDSISVSYALLGPFMAVIRPIAAICSAIAAGVLVGRDTPIMQARSEEDPSTSGKTAETSCCAPKSDSTVASVKTSCCAPSTSSSVTAAETSCCAPKSASVVVSAEKSCCAPSTANLVTTTETSCCTPKTTASVASEKVSCCAPVGQSHSHTSHTTSVHGTSANSSCCGEQPVAPTASVVAKLTEAMRYSSDKLLEDTMKWLMVGLFFAALIQTFVPTSFLAQWGNGILAMLVVILISIPMYICATASTPIAAGLLLAGVSPGAVLVFMLAGPATNIATIGVVANELGKRAVMAYLGGVIGVAIVFGYLTDFLVQRYGFTVSPLLGEEHSVLPDWLSLVSALLLAGLMARLMLRSLLARNRIAI
ncbi:SO_0444 family Cu/Zn efflux transporter [Pseudoalteromonas fenneropenaei]|uniref:SO_0444 family Cu/Zn efflux transporter n=1 Tax=Pseudoalteromonas fenneropenaei TaxID=1737459 RepID=A0ABV7CLJ2_9GAMM